MIIVWSSSSSGPYALIIPLALVVLSAFLEDFDVVLQGLRAGLSGFVGLAAVLAVLALACKASAQGPGHEPAPGSSLGLSAE